MWHANGTTGSSAGNGDGRYWVARALRETRPRPVGLSAGGRPGRPPQAICLRPGHRTGTADHSADRNDRGQGPPPTPRNSRPRQTLRVLAAERFPLRHPPVDHRQVLWGSAAWAQPSGQTGGLGLRGWTAEPPGQRRHGGSLTRPPETGGVGFEPSVGCFVVGGRDGERPLTCDADFADVDRS